MDTEEVLKVMEEIEALRYIGRHTLPTEVDEGLHTLVRRLGKATGVRPPRARPRPSIELVTPPDYGCWPSKAKKHKFEQSTMSCHCHVTYADIPE